VSLFRRMIVAYSQSPKLISPFMEAQIGDLQDSRENHQMSKSAFQNLTKERFDRRVLLTIPARPINEAQIGGLLVSGGQV